MARLARVLREFESAEYVLPRGEADTVREVRIVCAVRISNANGPPIDLSA